MCMSVTKFLGELYIAEMHSGSVCRLSLLTIMIVKPVTSSFFRFEFLLSRYVDFCENIVVISSIYVYMPMVQVWLTTGCLRMQYSLKYRCSKLGICFIL